MKIFNLIQPDVRPVQESGELYVLQQDYYFSFEYEGKVYNPTITAGFKYDGASVPRVFWSMVGLLPDGIHRPAALVHDWLYEGQGKWGNLSYDRAFADKFFYEALKYVGLKSWHARLAYIAVRIGGGFYWKD